MMNGTISKNSGDITLSLANEDQHLGTTKTAALSNLPHGGNAVSVYKQV